MSAEKLDDEIALLMNTPCACWELNQDPNDPTKSQVFTDTNPYQLCPACARKMEFIKIDPSLIHYFLPK